MAFVGLSRRAILDLEAIERFSIERWGSAVASGYMESIEQALGRLRENPALLYSKDDISPHFTFYRVREHFLVCTVSGERVYVLTVKYGGMDLPSRIAELEPHLLREAELLQRALDKKVSGLADKET